MIQARNPKTFWFGILIGKHGFEMKSLLSIVISLGECFGKLCHWASKVKIAGHPVKRSDYITYFWIAIASSIR